MIDDDFIESIITPKNETVNVDRKFVGIEAIATFDEEFMEAQSVARGEEREKEEEHNE